MPITALFLDIRGVLLTKGWDHQGRKRAPKAFVDPAEMEVRVIRIDEERTIAEAVCRVLGLGCKKEN